MNIRFMVLVNGLPEEYRRTGDRVKNSELKSLANSKFDVGKFSGNSTM